MNKNKVFICLSSLFVLVEILTILTSRFYLRHWLLAGMLLLPTFAMNPKSFANKQTVLLVIASGILFMFALAGHELMPPIAFIIDGGTILACMTISNVCIKNGDYVGLTKITFVGGFAVILQCVTTILAGATDPEAARSLVEMAAYGDHYNMVRVQQSGVASYGLIHSLPFAFPLLVCNLKEARNTLHKVLYIGIIAVLYFMIMKSYFATSLILSTFSILIALMLSKNSQINLLIGIIALPMILLFWNDEFAVEVLTGISQMFEHTAIQAKITDIIQSIDLQAAEGQLKGRMDLYSISWNTFFANPLFGNPDVGAIGGHAYLVDRLAHYGLIGTIPLVVFLFSMLAKIYTVIPKRKKVYYILGLLTFICLNFVKNLGGSEMYIFLFIILPGLSLMGEKRAVLEPRFESGNARLLNRGQGQPYTVPRASGVRTHG